MRAFGRISCPGFALAALCLVFSVCPSLGAQNPPAAGADAPLPCPQQFGSGREHCSIRIPPHQKLEFQIPVTPGMVRDVIVQQNAGLVHVLLDESNAPASGSRPAAFDNFAGLLSTIHLLVSAAAGAERRLTLNNDRERPAAIAIELGTAHASSAATDREQEAETSLARAESLRQVKASSRSAVLAEYDRAIGDWRSLRDFADEGRALTWEGFYLQRSQGDPAAALPLMQQAAQLISSMPPVEAANCWKTAGYIDAQLSHYDDARQAYDHALAAFETTGDVFNQEVLLENLSGIERMEGHTDQALQDATSAEALAEKIQDARGELGITEQIGAIYTTAGNLEQAYDAFTRGVTLLQAVHDPDMEGYIWSDLGVVYTQLADFGRAHDALNHASAVWARSPNVYGQLNTLDDTGDLLLAEGKPEEARTFYQRGLALSDKLGVHYRIFMLRGIGDSYLFQKDAENAQKYDEQALTLATQAKEGDSTAYLDCALGDAALLRNSAAAARGSFSRCDQEAQAGHSAILQIRAEAGLARVALDQGDLQNAGLHCETALGGIESQRRTLSFSELRTSWFASMHAYYDLDIQILARLDQLHPGEGYRWRAFLTAERGRARTLLDQFATAGENPATGASALQEQYDDVLRRLRLLEAEAAHRGSESRTASSAAQQLVARLTQEEHSLHDQVAEAKLNSAGAVAPLTLAGIQNALPANHSALLEYWTGEAAGYVWSVSGSGVRMMRIAPASRLEKEISGFRKAVLEQISLGPDVSAEQRAILIPAARRRTAMLATQLARALIPSGLLPPGTSTLLIVGDGPVLSVPFAALPLPFQPGSPSSRSSRIAVLSEPSAAILSLLESRPIETRPTEIAVFANDASSQAGASKAAVSLSTPNDFAPLAYASSEAATIRSIFGTSATHVFSGPSATATALRSFEWSPYTVGHFAMHALLNSHFAELNGLVMNTDAAATGNPQMLWYGDVCRLHARLDLVVLSACDTALGQNVPGEGLLGLTQAFFAAGSQRVLATLWPVDDQATSEWMRQFYLALKATGSPARAVSLAQRRMAAIPEWSAPWYWAGFTLAGDWRPLP